MSDWLDIASAPKDMLHVKGGGRPIEIYAELSLYGDEWAIVEWDDDRGWVVVATDEPLVYANDPGATVSWRELRDPPSNKRGTL